MAKLKATLGSDELPDPIECLRLAWNHAQTLDTALRDLHEWLVVAIEDLYGSGYKFEFSDMPAQLAQAIDVLDELSGEIVLAKVALDRDPAQRLHDQPGH